MEDGGGVLVSNYSHNKAEKHILYKIAGYELKVAKNVIAFRML